MKFILALIVLLVLLLAAAAGFVFSGIYDVSATTPHTGLVRWALETTQERSVEHRAREIVAPDLGSNEQLQHGLEEYQEMCVVCHGAPGIKPRAIGRGLYPEPPDLADSAKEMSAAELFWIIKNGVKMTGMPAFGVTHDDNTIWSMVAFIEKLPDMSYEEYQALLKNEGVEAPHGHEPEQVHKEADETAETLDQEQDHEASAAVTERDAAAHEAGLQHLLDEPSQPE